MHDAAQLDQTVRRVASQAGFDCVAVTTAREVDGGQRYDDWLARGGAGQMDYLRQNRDKRFHPDRLVEGARSVICLAVGYAPGPDEPVLQADPPRAFVARYARGRDYHKVLKKRCHRMMDELRLIVPDFNGRAFVDSAPLAERSLAAASGLGWIGRNGCLIVPRLGSYLVLCEIVCNLELTPDDPIHGDCGDCGACVRACPTGACGGDGLIDAPRCLSYLSIEYTGSIGETLRESWGCSVFGCDRCQQACPHNHDLPAGDPKLRSPAASESQLRIHAAPLAELLAWNEPEWDLATRGLALRRGGYDGFMRNVILASAASRDASLSEPLRQLLAGDDRWDGQVDWALSHLR